MRETAQEPKSMLKDWEQKDQEVRMAACVCGGGGRGGKKGEKSVPFYFRSYAS